MMLAKFARYCTSWIVRYRIISRGEQDTYRGVLKRMSIKCHVERD